MEELRKTWDKYTEGWLGIIIYIILGFFIAYFLNITLGLALSTDTPVVAVVSCSMKPLYDRGDMVVVQGGEIKEGDILVYNVATRSYPIIHRVIKINDDGTFETKGDYNAMQNAI